MLPLVLLAILASIGNTFAVIWCVRPRPIASCPWPPPMVKDPPSVVHDESMARYAIDAMVRVTELAIGPQTPPSQQADNRPMAAGAPVMAMEDVIDPRDPYEAYLGPDFVRTMETVFDVNDESPLGIPGLRPPQGF